MTLNAEQGAQPAQHKHGQTIGILKRRYSFIDANLIYSLNFKLILFLF